MQTKRVLPMAAVAVALSLSGCGQATTAATSSVFNMSSTNYQTLPPTQSTIPSTSTLPITVVPGGITTDTSEYVIQEGDWPITVAERFKISVDQLALANMDTPGYASFMVGMTIVIPAGATLPQDSGTTLPGSPTTTQGGGGSNCIQGTYVIVAGDLPSRVAKKFDITVDQLAAANINTSGYRNFVVGTEINIPKKDGCSG